MRKCNAPGNRTMLRILAGAPATALAAACTILLPHAALADVIKVPAVPANIQVQTGNQVFFVGHAGGTQNYVCLPSGTGVAFKLFTPEATLFDDEGKQVITHYFGPNPFEVNANPAVVTNNAIRVVWQHSDTSTVWGQVKTGNASSDPAFVAPGAVPWLLVTVVDTKDGPDGGDTLSDTTFIQRLNTKGGVAPSVGCESATDVGNEAFVPYAADYFFYRKQGR